jgi:hypothetical protein
VIQKTDQQALRAALSTLSEFDMSDTAASAEVNAALITSWLSKAVESAIIETPSPSNTYRWYDGLTTLQKSLKTLNRPWSFIGVLDEVVGCIVAIILNMHGPVEEILSI